VEGERKQVTVLFADLKGSMEVLADRDPEDARRLLDPVLERMMEAVHHYEGTVNQVMGDGIMALFGAPVAHEDHAIRACYAALRMQERIARYAEEVRRTAGVPIHVRIGLNSGEVVVRSIGSDLRMDYSAIGQTTHLAARMEQAAMPGSILIAPATLRLVEGYVTVRPLGPIAVKGLPGPVEAYEVVGAGPVRSRLQAAAARGLTRFVGRDREIEELRQALARAGAGQGQVVAIVGDAGVGKSRLVWEFTRSHRTRDWLVVESASVSYGKATTYYPVIELLRAYFRIEARDDGRAVREKVTGKLLALDRALEPWLPALLALLDAPVDDPGWAALEPAQRRRQTLEAVRRLLLRESRVQPLLLVFEDLHWIDEATQALLDSLVESLPTARLLVLVNYRPEYRHGWAGRSYYRQLRLDPLPPESAEQLLAALLGTSPALAPVQRLLVRRTEGNPFFLEETVRTLVETGVLAGAPGAYRLAGSLAQVQVPATVQALLAARIDRLPPADKQLLQSAAVIGKDVPLPLLQVIAGLPEDDLRAALGRLQAAEFLYEASLFPEPEYTFKHALTHEVAYQGLLQDRQRALHAAVLEACERLYAGRLGEHVERLAYHAVRGAVPERAARYLLEAGGRAVARSAHREAVAFLAQASDALGRLEESPETLSRALDVQLALGPALLALEGTASPEVERCYARAQELARRLGDPARLFPAIWGAWYVRYRRGEYGEARALAAHLLETGRAGGDATLLLEAHHSSWATLLGGGALLDARRHLEEGLVIYDPGRHRGTAYLYGGHDPGVCCRTFLAWALWDLGQPDRALARAREAERLARELGHPLSLVQALGFTAFLHHYRGDDDAAWEAAEACVAVSATHDFALWRALGRLVTGRLLVARGRTAEGLGQLAEAAPTLGGWRMVLGACLLAEAHGVAGDPARGLEVLARALEAAGRNGIGYHLAELHRLTGDLLAQHRGAPSAEAAAHCRRALEVAQAPSARALELRAATSLARLLAREGRRDEGRATLAPVYAGFAEGLDTRDLLEAQRLLTDL
jgi:class 3 adenylate cyclase/predicted ATPase